MKVHELIRALKKCNQSAQVEIAGYNCLANNITLEQDFTNNRDNKLVIIHSAAEQKSDEHIEVERLLRLLGDDLKLSLLRVQRRV